jgi:hypothetical protein
MSWKKRERKARQIERNKIQNSEQFLLKRVLASEQIAGESKPPLIVHSPQGMRKMSEILLEFAEPDLEQAHTFEDRQKAISFVILAWNLSLFKPFKRMLELKRLSTEMAILRDDSLVRDLRVILRQLIQRKKERYPSIKRLVLDWNLVQTGSTGFHLNVVSTVLSGAGADRNDIKVLEKFLQSQELNPDKQVQL